MRRYVPLHLRPFIEQQEWMRRWDGWLSGRVDVSRWMVIYDPVFALWQRRFGEMLDEAQGCDRGVLRLRQLRRELERVR